MGEPEEEDPDCPGGVCPEGEPPEDEDEDESSAVSDECSTCAIPRCLICRGKNCNRCKQCEEGTRRAWRRNRCLLKDEKDPDCPDGVCPLGDPPEDGDEDDSECSTCAIPKCNKCMGKNCNRCKECKAGTRRAWRRNKCLEKDEKDPDCPKGACPLGAPPDDDDEDDSECSTCSIPKCNKCMGKKCNRCKECKAGTRR